MAEPTKQQVLDALKTVEDKDRGSNVVTLGMIAGIVIRDGNVGFSIEIEPEEAERKEALRAACEQAVLGLPGVISATGVLTAERKAQTPSPERRAAPERAAPERAAPERPALPGIRAVVAVASGKGGVGKSTTAVNLAVAMAGLGKRIGLLDADIYGPSVPRMMRLQGQPTSPDGKILYPMENHGVRCMSIGFLVGEETPMIWRGPMVMSALEQMLRDVAWGELDLLMIDLPPGTGDAQLTISQRVPLAGAIIVSTPQDIALLDARKGLNMFRQVQVPVFGIIENMSYYICPNCGDRADIFSHGGAKTVAERLGTEFLGEIPLDIEIRETSDAGLPIVTSKPESPHAEAYRAIARRVLERVDEALGDVKRQAPKIVIQ
ncbi:MAG: iron-sulfur cluster carrier protein ApbC [Alphaproteobacteria bacterium]